MPLWPQTLVYDIRSRIREGGCRFHWFKDMCFLLSMKTGFILWNGISQLLSAWWQCDTLVIAWKLLARFLKKWQHRNLKNGRPLEIKSQGQRWNTLLSDVASPKLLMSQKVILCEKHKHQWLWVEKRLTKVKFWRQICCRLAWPIYFAHVFHFLYAP